MLEKFGEMQLGGNGGINRGPGPAPLQFGAPSSEDGTEFKEEKLGPSVPDQGGPGRSGHRRGQRPHGPGITQAPRRGQPLL